MVLSPEVLKVWLTDVAQLHPPGEGDLRERAGEIGLARAGKPLEHYALAASDEPADYKLGHRHPVEAVALEEIDRADGGLGVLEAAILVRLRTFCEMKSEYSSSTAIWTRSENAIPAHTGSSWAERAVSSSAPPISLSLLAVSALAYTLVLTRRSQHRARSRSHLRSRRSALCPAPTSEPA